MVGVIPVVQKWQPFIEKTLEQNDSSATQMDIALSRVIKFDTDVEECNMNEIFDSIINITNALKNIENDESIEYRKRRELAKDLVKHIYEQKDVFSKKCKCSTK